MIIVISDLHTDNTAEGKMDTKHKLRFCGIGNVRNVLFLSVAKYKLLLDKVKKKNKMTKKEKLI